jgi:methylenetetrahydrofolate reductase (NADPH)
MTAAAAAACPKHMVHGPCGGVQEDCRCEVDARRCAFVDGAAPPDGPAPDGGGPAEELNPAAAALLAILARRPLIVADLPSVAGSPESQRAAAAAVAGPVDVALLGDAPWARVQLPPTLRAAIVVEEGVPVWAGLNCRDRNRAALEGELLGLAAVGAAGVHCVTGDHPVLGDRADAAPVFDLDGPRLAALAAGRGLLVSVAEAPSAPPTADRPARAARKARAGARVCFVNHAVSVAAVADFVARVRELAPELRCVACVPLAVSAAGAERLAAFTGGVPPAHTASAAWLRDPIGAGVRAAVAHAEALLAIDGVDGVDLSAAAGPGEELPVAAALALAAGALGGGT